MRFAKLNPELSNRVHACDDSYKRSNVKYLVGEWASDMRTWETMGTQRTKCKRLEERIMMHF